MSALKTHFSSLYWKLKTHKKKLYMASPFIFALKTHEKLFCQTFFSRETVCYRNCLKKSLSNTAISGSGAWLMCLISVQQIHLWHVWYTSFRCFSSDFFIFLVKSYQNTFLEKKNSFTREALEERIHFRRESIFLYYRGEAKKK
jgi:hypothetical protein